MAMIRVERDFPATIAMTLGVGSWETCTIDIKRMDWSPRTAPCDDVPCGLGDARRSRRCVARASGALSPWAPASLRLDESEFWVVGAL